MKRLIVFILLILTSVTFAYPRARDAKSTFQNGYRFSGNSGKDNATKWAQGLEELVEAGFQIGTGDIFYVDSGVTTEGDGTSWLKAKDTIDEAVNLCTANAGDVILVAQGHAETKSATGNLVTCDVAGVTIVGMGSGSLRPSITLSDPNAVAFNVDAANVTIANVYIDATGADSVNTPIDVGAARCTIDSIEMLMADGTGQADTGITTSGAANAANYLTILNSRFVSPNAGASEAILLEEVQEGVVIAGCYAYGDFSVAAIHNPTGKVLTNLMIKDCILKNDQTGDFALELVSACTGFLIGNYYQGDTAAALVDPGSCFSFECYGVDAIDEGAFIRPAVGSP